MSSKSTPVDSPSWAGSLRARAGILPARRDLAPDHATSLAIALLMAAASVAGLVARAEVYPGGELSLAFVPGDAFNLAVGLPILLGSLWLARRGRLTGLLLWPGALFYVLYAYIPYLLAVPVGVLSLPYLLLVGLSAATLIRVVRGMDGESIGRRLAPCVPARTSAAILIGLGVLIIGRQGAGIVAALAGRGPVESLEVATWVADFCVAAPALLVVGVGLWRRRPLGYVGAAGLFLGYALLAVSLISTLVFSAWQTDSPVDGAGVAAVLVMAALCLIPLALVVRGTGTGRRATGRRSSMLRHLNATRVIATTIGVLCGLSGVNHGLFEFLQGNTPTPGLIIQAIGPAQRFWPLGTEEALTIVPNFLISGLLSMALGVAIVIWSLRFLHSRRGPAVFLGLFVALFLVGGGIGQVALFVPAWAFAQHMERPPAWAERALRPRVRPFLSRLWAGTLALSMIAMLVGIEIAIFGYLPGVTDPATLQNTAMLLVLTSAVLNVISFVAGFGHELGRREMAA
jgi:hypothetical protein